jgi:hypothetical protein
MKTLSNFLIISGEGRNVSKTILACNIISKFSRDHTIIGLKLTPYVHENVGNAEVVIANKDLILHEETENYTRKDSSRMLAAGAHKAYLLHVSDEKLITGFDAFMNLIEKDALVVCESEKLYTIINPGISLYIRHISCQTETNQKQLPEESTARIVNFSINSFDIDLNSIQIENKNWKLIEKIS